MHEPSVKCVKFVRSDLQEQSAVEEVAQGVFVREQKLLGKSASRKSPAAREHSAGCTPQASEADGWPVSAVS